MPSAPDELQKVFKTLSDPTRMRILRLLEREELVVQELMEVLGMAQSRVSRHLAILREAGLLSDRRNGTYVSYRFSAPPEGAWREAWTVVKRNLGQDSTSERDDVLLQRVIEARGTQSKSFFDSIGPEWDALRKVFNDEALRARAIERLVAPGLKVADVGTGTAILACELGRLGLDVIGIDHSRRMLEAAQQKVDAQSFPVGGNVELRHGEASDIPIANGEVDASLAHIVLHYVASPGDVIREMARIVKPGGAIVIVDFVEHDHEWMRQELGVVWMGFAMEDIRGFFIEAGLPDVRIEQIESAARGRDLPTTFIASARRPLEASRETA